MEGKYHTYHWQGINKQGQKVSGSAQEASLVAVKYQLQRQGINTTKVRRKRKSLLTHYRNRITPTDIAIISRQVATMLGAGVPLVQSLHLIARATQKSSVHQLMTSLALDVENGTPLSIALKKYPQQFSELYCDLVQSGEQTGALDHIFDQIAVYREKAERLKSKIKKALFYPTMVLVIAGIVTAILLLFVIPQFEEVFNSFGAPLPLFTQWVIALSRGLQNSWLSILIGIVLTLFIYSRIWHSSPRVRHVSDRVLLSLPIVGSILRKAALTGFARTLATTFAAGIPLVDGLTSAAGACGNRIYRQAVLQVRANVIIGLPMNTALRATQLFPDMVVQMVTIGEETGAIDSMMDKVASIYEREVDDAIEGLTSLIEPLMMLILGILVGALVIAMYLPIFDLGNVIR
ncbi:type II secretion system F family protein [Oceanisphaera ostreae]|uniref:Type II secretion system F family protein n=1 Tax=Oceanisphaera ostreae TaxID=914151 RepID=A0ABW3KDU4_9GAMM